MKKQLTKTIVGILLALILATSFITPAFASSVISDVDHEWLFDVPDQPYTSNNCTNISGIGIGKTQNSLFVVKSHDTDNHTDAAFFYYPDMNYPSTCRIYRLKYAGHANGMAVDNNYIYITASSNAQNPNYPHPNTYNCIIRISRSLIASLSNGATINYSDYTTFEPVKEVSGTYSTYGKNISMITKYNTNGKFIINFDELSTSTRFAFTTAEIKTVGGQEKFVISTNHNDIFFVENNLSGSGTSKVDICYSPNCGLFIPKWYGKMAASKTNRNKNVILWVNNVNGSYTNVSTTYGSCNCYTPRKINHVVTDVDGDYTLTKFEMESVAFDQNDEFIFSANIQYTKTSQIGLDDADTYDDDGIFRLYHNGTNHKFLLTNYNVF